MKKREIITLFNEIENDIMRLFNNSIDCNRDSALIMQKLSILAHQVSDYLQSISLDNDDDKILVEKTEIALKDIVDCVFGIMNCFNSANICGFDSEFKSRLCNSLGRLALILRFTIAFRPDLSYRNENISCLYEQLKNLNELYNDYYTYNHMFQNTVWKFLQRIDIRDTAIVVQGPVIYENDFTIETMYRYRWLYPNAIIILSTWKGEIQDFFRWQANSIGIVLIENEMPAEHGISNIRLQLISSHQGILCANKYKEIKYVMKTRTDQRIFLPDFLSYMRNMLKTFDVKSEILKERIVFLGGYQSSCLCPFEMCDFLTFGNVDDMKEFYNSTGESTKLIPERMNNPDYLEKRARPLRDHSHYDNYVAMKKLGEEKRRFLCKKFMEYLDPETYIVLSFYQRVILGRELMDSDDVLKMYWEFLKNCVVIVDSDHLFLYWFKYEHRYLIDSSLTSMGSLTTSVWMDIYYSNDI